MCEEVNLTICCWELIHLRRRNWMMVMAMLPIFTFIGAICDWERCNKRMQTPISDNKFKYPFLIKRCIGIIKLKVMFGRDDFKLNKLWSKGRGEGVKNLWQKSLQQLKQQKNIFQVELRKKWKLKRFLRIIRFWNRFKGSQPALAIILQ